MDEKSDNKPKFRCKICNKNYSSKSSLWNHTKKLHDGQKQSLNNQKQSFNNQNDDYKESLIEIKLLCLFCNKKFTHYNNKWRHQKTCKLNCENINKNIELEKIKLEQIKLEQFKAEQFKLERIKYEDCMKYKQDFDYCYNLFK